MMKGGFTMKLPFGIQKYIYQLQAAMPNYDTACPFSKDEPIVLEDKENITIAPKLDGILNFSFNKDSAAKAMKEGEIEAKKYVSKIKKRIKQIEESENV